MISIVRNLTVLLGESKMRVRVGSVYRHYKGNEYQVTDVVLDEKRIIPLVIYKDSKIGISWSRELDDFCSDVDIDGKMVPRFKLMD